MKTGILPGFYESENFYANLRTLKTDFRIEDLINYPEQSMGFALAAFLLEHYADKNPVLEDRDIYHVLTNTGLSAKSQIGLQFYLIGNGKKDMIAIVGAAIGALLYVHSFPLFLKQYRRGKSALLFHQLEFTKMLNQPLSKIRETFLIQ